MIPNEIIICSNGKILIKHKLNFPVFPADMAAVWVTEEALEEAMEEALEEVTEATDMGATDDDMAMAVAGGGPGTITGTPQSQC